MAQGSDLRRIESICRALGANLDVRVRWRGEGLDRLLDEAHARLVETIVKRLQSFAWECAVEVSFNDYGERGSIDVLAWHPSARALLVIEVKSVVPDVQATIFGLDRKARLGPKVAAARGWDVVTTSRPLVVRETSASRRRIDGVESVFEVAFPAPRIRGASLASPAQPLALGPAVSAGFHPGSHWTRKQRAAAPWAALETPRNGLIDTDGGDGRPICPAGRARSVDVLSNDTAGGVRRNSTAATGAGGRDRA